MSGTSLVSSLPLLAGATAVVGPALQPLVTGAAPLTDSGGADTAKAFEAAAAHSQWLTSLALLVIGGSMLVLLHRDYVRPGTRLGRAFFVLFIAGWAFLTLSIWKGARTQEVYLAFLMNPPHGVQRLASLHASMNSDLGRQIIFLQRGLAVFGLWLLAYLIWWLSGGDLRDGATRTASAVIPREQTTSLGIVVLFVILGSLALSASALAECDCDHYPYQPDPPCDRVCSTRVFSNSIEADLMVLGIDRPLAHAVIEARHANHGLSLAGLQPAEQQELRSALMRAQPAVLHFLASPLAEKPRLASQLQATQRQSQQAAASRLAEEQKAAGQRVTVGQQARGFGVQAQARSYRGSAASSTPAPPLRAGQPAKRPPAPAAQNAPAKAAPAAPHAQGPPPLL